MNTFSKPESKLHASRIPLLPWLLCRSPVHTRFSFSAGLKLPSNILKSFFILFEQPCLLSSAHKFGRPYHRSCAGGQRLDRRLLVADEKNKKTIN